MDWPRFEPPVGCMIRIKDSTRWFIIQGYDGDIVHVKWSMAEAPEYCLRMRVYEPEMGDTLIYPTDIEKLIWRVDV